jgi:hypothetical protein
LEASSNWGRWVEEKDGGLVEGASPASGRRVVLKFAAVHLGFLATCIGTGELIFVFSGAQTVFAIGPGKEFPTLKAAEEALDVQNARIWVGVCALSALVVLGAWLWKRAFAWYWIPLACVPLLGQLFFAMPASWAIANGRIEPPRSSSGTTLEHDATTRLGETGPLRQ